MLFENENLISLLPWNTIFRNMAVTAALAFFIIKCRQEKLPIQWKQAFALLLFFWAGSLLGARLFSIFDRGILFGQPLEWEAFFQRATVGMLRWYGSVLVLVLLLPVVVKVFDKNQRWKVFDLFCIALCLFTVFVKQGCQFAGDGCYGIPTTLPWGMYYSGGLRPSLLPVHPTPVYDSLFHLLLFFVLLKWRKRPHSDGQAGLIYFMATASFCFFLEFIRTNQVMAMGLTLAQWTYLSVLVIACLNWILLRSPQSLKVSTCGVAPQVDTS